MIERVYVVLRRSPDVSPKLAEIKAVVSTREEADRFREEVFERTGVVTEVEVYAVRDERGVVED